MTLYKCNNCGVKIADKVLIIKLTEVYKKGFISRQEFAEAKRKIKQGVKVPYVSCHSGCGDTLEAV